MNNMKLNKKIITLTMGGIALVLLLVILSTIGSVNLSLGEIFSALINNDNKIEFLGIGFLRNNSKTKKNKNRLIKAFENT